MTTTATDERTKHAYEQASAQMSSIAEMLAALDCDYDRLEELREEFAEWEARVETQNEAVLTRAEWAKLNPDVAAELADLEEAAGDCEDMDDAQQRISDDPLEVQVRFDWYSPGDELPNVPAEFKILLCTGGPAVRIVGELNERGEPDRAWLEFQDWGTPWIEYHGENADGDALVRYAAHFLGG